MSGESLKPQHVTSAAIRILVLSTDPMAREVRQITRRLRAIPDAARLEIVHESAVRLDDLRDALQRHQPTIVHFSQHGESATVDAVALAERLRIAGGVRCVVLDGCFTEEHGEILRRRTDCVIGMTSSLTYPAAIAFAWAFYQALGSGNSVGTAFALGCSQIALEEPAQQEIPRLVTRDGVIPFKAWLFSSTNHARGRAPARSRSETLTDCGRIRLQQRDNGRTVIMTLRGSLDEESSPALCEYVDLILASECQELTLDLGEVDLLDSSGLVVIVKIFKGMRNSNRVARFTNARGQPLHFMHRLGIDRIFNLE